MARSIRREPHSSLWIVPVLGVHPSVEVIEVYVMGMGVFIVLGFGLEGVFGIVEFAVGDL